MQTGTGPTHKCLVPTCRAGLLSSFRAPAARLQPGPPAETQTGRCSETITHPGDAAGPKITVLYITPPAEPSAMFHTRHSEKLQRKRQQAKQHFHVTATVFPFPFE